MSNTERVAKLSERLKALQHNIKSGRTVRSNELELRIQSIEEQFGIVHERNSKKFEALKDDVNIKNMVVNKNTGNVRRRRRQEG